jgi:hypothetical protein
MKSLSIEIVIRKMYWLGITVEIAVLQIGNITNLFVSSAYKIKINPAS